MSELQAFHDRVARISQPDQLFGALAGGTLEQSVALKHLYRQMVKVTHEDKYEEEADKATARTAFGKLTYLFNLARTQVEAGTYGKVRVIVAQIKTPLGTYGITDPFAAGDLANLYRASNGSREVLVKVARDPSVNDLLTIEAKALKLLNTTAAGTASFKFFVPELVEASRAALTPNDARAVNILAWEPGWVPLTEVLSYHPEGVDPRHGVWIWKRLLSILSFAHGLGMVHGAVLPTHVLVNPDNHGVRLIDWSYSVARGTTVKALSRPWKMFYPPEVLTKRPSSFATDIYMSARTLAWVLGGEDNLSTLVPAQMARFLLSCMIDNPVRRPSNAFGLYESFNEVATAVFGRPRFVPLVLARSAR